MTCHMYTREFMRFHGIFRILSLTDPSTVKIGIGNRKTELLKGHNCFIVLIWHGSYMHTLYYWWHSYSLYELLLTLGVLHITIKYHVHNSTKHIILLFEMSSWASFIPRWKLTSGHAPALFQTASFLSLWICLIMLPRPGCLRGHYTKPHYPLGVYTVCQSFARIEMKMMVMKTWSLPPRSI